MKNAMLLSVSALLLLLPAACKREAPGEREPTSEAPTTDQPPSAQAPPDLVAPGEIVKFREPIPFHGGTLIGFEETTILKTASTAWRPSQAGDRFITVKLELRRPFDYARAMFREVTLTDTTGRIYQYRGWLTDNGWLHMDDAEVKNEKPGEVPVLVKLEAEKYPHCFDIHFEVPESAQGLVLKVANRTEALHSRLALKAPEASRPAQRVAGLPAFAGDLVGGNEIRVRNPNDFEVSVGVRSLWNGKDFVVAANGVASVLVPDGHYEIYFVYSSEPGALYQGDSFTLDGNGAEIQIVQVVGGNYGIRRVK
ncbi:MAG: hypothetical protein JW955_19360 [Sedimentisphaerales bacterium]|nr:hypothetical protein [Sedimentisphaerales bacterium]